MASKPGRAPTSGGFKPGNKRSVGRRSPKQVREVQLWSEALREVQQEHRISALNEQYKDDPLLAVLVAEVGNMSQDEAEKHFIKRVLDYGLKGLSDAALKLAVERLYPKRRNTLPPLPDLKLSGEPAADIETVIIMGAKGQILLEHAQMLVAMLQGQIEASLAAEEQRALQIDNDAMEAELRAVKGDHVEGE